MNYSLTHTLTLALSQRERELYDAFSEIKHVILHRELDVPMLNSSSHWERLRKIDPLSVSESLSKTDSPSLWGRLSKKDPLSLWERARVRARTRVRIKTK